MALFYHSTFSHTEKPKQPNNPITSSPPTPPSAQTSARDMTHTPPTLPRHASGVHVHRTLPDGWGADPPQIPPRLPISRPPSPEQQPPSPSAAPRHTLLQSPVRPCRPALAGARCRGS